MPNIIRWKRGHYPPPLIQYLILQDPLQDPSTHLSYHKRDIAYSLKHYASYTHEKIGYSLGISRQTILNSLYNNT